ncbi:MAG: GNAT family N-acetyltransferase [Mycobacterium sp.]
MEGLVFVEAGQDDELAAPLIAELAVEYSTRYDVAEARMLDWLRGHPPAEFAAPDGAMLIGLLDGRPVTGGAFRRFGLVDSDPTAELKRIWTDSRYRRRGYGRILLAELESRIAALGYRRVYLTTGDRQPEAEALYTAAGYRRLAEPRAGGEAYPLAFEKVLSPGPD